MRAGRLITLLLILQRRGRVTAGELATELEVSERTVLRDIEALSGAGVPVYATRGPGGGFQCDVAEAADRAELIRRTEAELGTIDILVNNAGIERVARFEQALETDITDTLTINLEAPMLLTRAIVPGMLARNHGHVVNIASGAGKVGVAYGSSYCASKHGLVGFTNALRSEYRGRPVGFSVVCPGFVTDAGMYDRWEKNGIRAPRIAGTSKPEKVAEVTVRCIKRNKAEVTVNTPPVRPLIVLANIAPSIVPALLHRLGYAKVFERVMDAEAGAGTK